MSGYGDVAVKAVKLYAQKKCDSPAIAWRTAAEELLRTPSVQKKGCPKNAFLGLCDEGYVRGIPRGQCGKQTQNGDYAVNAVRLLVQTPDLSKNKAGLWKRVTGGEKKHNSQMDVVVRLWDEGLINGTKD